MSGKLLKTLASLTKTWTCKLKTPLERLNLTRTFLRMGVVPLSLLVFALMQQCTKCTKYSLLCNSFGYIQVELRQMVLWYFPAGNFMFKVNNKNTTTRCEICSKLTIKTVVLVCLLLTWTYFTPCSSVFIVNFEQVNACWARKWSKMWSLVHLLVLVYLSAFTLFWCLYL